jgi:hypothetical protein
MLMTAFITCAGIAEKKTASMECPSTCAGAVVEGPRRNCGDCHAIMLLFKGFVFGPRVADILTHSPPFALREKAAFRTGGTRLRRLDE